MGVAKKYKSDIMRAVQEGVSDLYQAGVADKSMIQAFDKRCLTPVETMTPEDIRALRDREHISQSLLASYPYVSVNTVGQWERGEREPSGPSLKLLAVAKVNGLEAIR